MKRPFVQLLLAAVLGSLLTLSLPAIAEVATRAASGNADKLDGNHAHQLGRVMYSWNGTPTNPLSSVSDGTPSPQLDLATGFISAPRPGWLRITGAFSISSNTDDGSPGNVENRLCALKVNSEELEDWAKTPHNPLAETGIASARCTTSTVVEVPRGEHRVTLYTHPFRNDDFFQAHVTTEYYRFNAEGKKSTCNEFPCPSFGTIEGGTGSRPDL